MIFEWIGQERRCMQCLFSNIFWICGVLVWHPMLPVLLEKVLPLERGKGESLCLPVPQNLRSKKKDQKEKDIVVIEDSK